MGLERTGLDIIIRTPADLSGAKAVEEQLERDILKAKLLGNSYDGLEAKLRRVQTVIKEQGGDKSDAGGFGALLEKLGAGDLSGKIAGIAAGFASIGAAIGVAKHGLSEFAQAEERVAGLDAALAQAGLLTEDYRVKLQDLAAQLQETTSIADDEWIGVLRRLTQFGSTPQSIGMDVEAVKNLAGIVGNVSTAAELYSKALQGNFEAFGRYGIIIDEAGDKTEKLTRLQEDLARRGGGQLEAMAKTLNGQFRDLKNNTADLFEAIGRGESNTGLLQDALYGLSQTAKSLGSILGGTVPQVDGLKNALTRTIAPGNEAADAALRYAAAQDAIKTAATATTTAINDQITAIKNKQHAEDQTTDAEMALALTRIEASEAAGRLTPEQALQAKSSTRTSFGNKKRLAANKADAEQMALIDQEVNSRLEQRDEAQVAVDEAQSNLHLVKQAASKREAATAAKSKYSENLKELIDLETELGNLTSGNGTSLIGGNGGTITEGELQTRIDGLRLYLEKLRRNASSTGAASRSADAALPPGAPGSVAEAAALLKLKREAQGAADAGSIDRLHDLGGTRDELSNNIEQRNRVGGIENQTESAGLARALIEKLKADQAKGDQETAAALEQLSNGMSRRDPQILYNIALLTRKVADGERRHADQQRQIEQLYSRISNVRTP